MWQLVESRRRASPPIPRYGDVPAGAVRLDRTAADRDAPAVRQLAVPRSQISPAVLPAGPEGVGDAGMDAMWSASTIEVVGPGIDDLDFADKLSR
ncbi:hypothetical protein HEK616_35200 [Streptomyces nigrescens]|uniref:Uncharacterized protein n=1 Tax=Streptomyces nigrescens TaxID=1920 RepID=A0ABM7ZV44_STRNI|nr:hypothetical protein HEK616_35200 [Streptomyces nigrescens]